ncbi:hypothetical protein, partial [Sphingomonas alba]
AVSVVEANASASIVYLRIGGRPFRSLLALLRNRIDMPLGVALPAVFNSNQCPIVDCGQLRVIRIGFRWPLTVMAAKSEESPKSNSGLRPHLQSRD